MLPIYLALVAYLVNAVVFLVDKYLLAAPIPRPLAYAFWVAILSGFAVVLIPFGVIIPSGLYAMVAFLSGMAMFLGLIFLYESIMVGDISVAATKVGAVSAASTYFFSLFILPDQFQELNSVAILFLILGIVFLARAEGKTVLVYSIISGMFFGLSLVLLKWVFNHGDFVNGLFWTRIFFTSSAFLVLLSPEARAQIKKFFTRSSRRHQGVFVVNKVMAAVGFFVLYLAINRGSVVTINALQGFQFVFVFVLALLFQPIFPQLERRLTHRAIINKIAGIALIVLGFAIVLI